MKREIIILLGSYLCLPSVANADCVSYVADLINYAKSSTPARIEAGYVVKQGNGLSASSTSEKTLSSSAVMPANLDWDGTYLTSVSTKSGMVTSPGKILFSDRFYGENPYSIYAPETIDMYINSNGYIWIYNRVWNFWTSFQAQCSNNVMYGWGAPIGNANGSNLAMYVFSFQKINYGFL